ncbi:hypothetical protein R80B4_01762 [Fibrobacteres bacterium R8-0-B4]
MLNERDRGILEHIVAYCEEIKTAIAMFDDTLETLMANSVYKNAVSMCILQIGELTTHFSKEFLAANTKVPWVDIKKMRNIAAHHYGKFDMEVLYRTIINKIPELNEYCFELLNDEVLTR